MSLGLVPTLTLIESRLLCLRVSCIRCTDLSVSNLLNSDNNSRVGSRGLVI